MVMTTLELAGRLLVQVMNAASPMGCDPLKGVSVLVNTPMVCPGKAELVVIAWLFVNKSEETSVYCLGLTSVVAWPKTGQKDEGRRMKTAANKDLMVCFISFEFGIWIS